MIFFRLTSWELGLLFFAVIFGATGLGVFLGHRVRHLSDTLKEPFGVLQAALLGVVALLLAFGLSLAVSRYEDSPLEHRHRGQRDRHDVSPRPDPGGAGPQPLARPARRATRGAPCASRTRCRAATRRTPPAPRRSGSSAGCGAWREMLSTRRRSASAPRLYVETLNEMFDGETVRVAALSNRVPTAVLVLEVLGSALALGLLAAYLVIVGRGVLAVLLASVLVAFLLLVTADLDRPTRGMIQVPDTVLRDQLASMEEPPAAAAPRSRSAR